MLSTTAIILIAVFVIGSLLSILIFAVVCDTDANAQIERDAINRRIANQRRTDGTILKLRTQGRVP